MNKMTAVLGDRPVLAWVIDALRAASIAEIVVVTGHEADGLRDTLADDTLDFAHNPDHVSGMGSSIAHGVAAIGSDVDGVLVCLGDMPAIEARTIESLVSEFKKTESIVVPIHAGRRGHPVLFGAHYFPALRALRGAGGARTILDKARADVVEVECGDPGIHRDIDTPTDLADLRERIRDR